jgi:hypothetical protein
MGNCNITDSGISSSVKCITCNEPDKNKVITRMQNKSKIDTDILKRRTLLLEVVHIRIMHETYDGYKYLKKNKKCNIK